MKPLDVCLIPPSASPVGTGTPTFLPTGLLSLVAVLRRQAGVRVSVTPVPLCFRNRRQVDEAAERILASRPEVVGFSCWCNSYTGQLLLARRLKRRRKDLVVVFGGPHATATDTETLRRFPCVDFVVRGEAEESFPDLLTRLREGRDPASCPGVTCRAGGHVVRAPDAEVVSDLGALPFPAFDLLPPQWQFHVEAGRGCPFRCAFCSTQGFFHRRHRVKPPERLLEEVTWLYRQRGARYVSFLHDLFTFDRSFVLDWCARFRASALPLTWSCTGHVNCLDEDLLREMRDAGCRVVAFGVESGSPRVLHRIGKDLRLERLPALLDAAARLGLRVQTNFIVGFPSERPEDLERTLAVAWSAHRRRARVLMTTLVPLPGTPILDEHARRMSYDGRSAFSPGLLLSRLEEGLVRRHPALFSSYYHLPSAAGKREFLLRLVPLVNLLRFFRYTLLLLERTDGATWDEGPWLPRIRAWLSRKDVAAAARRGGIEAAVLGGLRAALAERSASRSPWAPALEGVFRVERLSYELEWRRTAREIDLRFQGWRVPSGRRPGAPRVRKPAWRTLRAKCDLVPLLNSLKEDGKVDQPHAVRPCWYVVRKGLGVEDFRLHHVSAAEARVLRLVRDGMPLRELRRLTDKTLGAGQVQPFLARLAQLELIGLT